MRDARDHGRSRFARTVALAALCFTWRTRVARAQSIEEPVRLEYRAAAGCPTFARFQSAVASHTARGRPPAEGESARTFVIEIAAESDRIEGHLTIIDLDGAQAIRSVAGRRCDDVAGALALMTALAIDPEASIHPIEREAPPPPAPTPATTTASPSPLPPQEPPAARWDVGLGALVTARGGILPDVAASPGIVLELRRIVEGVVGPTFRLAVDAARSAHIQGPGRGSASLLWSALRVEGCPVPISFASFGRVEICAAFEAGAWRGSGLDVAHPASELRGFAAPAGVGRVSFDLGKRFFSSVEGAAFAPLARPLYRLSPDIVIFQAPAMSGWGGATIGLRFP